MHGSKILKYSMEREEFLVYGEMLMYSIILYHATLPKNVESIKRVGLVIPGGCSRYKEAGQSDSESVYLSNLPSKENQQAANLPSEMFDKDIVYIKVGLEKRDLENLLADDDWMIVRFVEEGDMEWEDWDSMSPEDKDDLSKDYWRESLESGFGVRYHGNIPVSKIIGYMPAHIDCGGNVSFES